MCYLKERCSYKNVVLQKNGYDPNPKLEPTYWWGNIWKPSEMHRQSTYDRVVRVPFSGEFWAILGNFGILGFLHRFEALFIQFNTNLCSKARYDHRGKFNDKFLRGSISLENPRRFVTIHEWNYNIRAILREIIPPNGAQIISWKIKKFEIIENWYIS